MNMKKEIKYEDALHELEEISRNMESGEYDVDELATQLKKAQKLIKLCRDKLTKTDQEIQKTISSV